MRHQNDETRLDKHILDKGAGDQLTSFLDTIHLTELSPRSEAIRHCNGTCTVVAPRCGSAMIAKSVLIFVVSAISEAVQAKAIGGRVETRERAPACMISISVRCFVQQQIPSSYHLGESKIGAEWCGTDVGHSDGNWMTGSECR
jgi:hypothetical protein